MPATKLDNDYLADKVALRVDYSPWPDDRPLRVLDAYGGRGVVWAGVARVAAREVERTAIDSRKDLAEFHLHGDNLKVIASIDLSGFDVVDLDAYGVPVEQISALMDAGFRGVVFVTMIQSVIGRMPNAMLSGIGIPAAVSSLAPTLIARRGWDYFTEWLASRAVTQIVHRSGRRKHYMAFRLNGAAVHVAGCDSRRAGSAAGLS